MIGLYRFVALFCFTISPFLSYGGDSMPPELLAWKIPKVMMEGTETITNGESQCKGVYRIRSWYFEDEQIHALDSQKQDDLRLVIYMVNESRSLSYWSKGADETFGLSMAMDMMAKNIYALNYFTPLGLQRNILKTLSDEKNLEVLPSSTVGEGTITNRKQGTQQGKTFRDDSIHVYKYSNNRLISQEGSVLGNDLQTGKQYGPYPAMKVSFLDYDSSYPVPMHVVRTDWHGKEIGITNEWKFQVVRAIPPNTTARQVLSELTAGLTYDRWPAKRRSSSAESKRTTKNAHIIMITGVAFAVLLGGFYLKKRRREA